MKLMKTLIVILVVYLSFVTNSYGDLIDDVCKKSFDYKLRVSFLRANSRRSSADNKDLTRCLLSRLTTFIIKL